MSVRHVAAIGLLVAMPACILLVGADEHHLKIEPEAGRADGAVRSTSDAGIVIASGQSRPGVMFGTAGIVFWVDEADDGGASIHKVGKKGGTVVTLAEGRPPIFGLRAESSFVYFSDGTPGLFSVNRDFGGDPALLSKDDYGYGPIAFADYLYSEARREDAGSLLRRSSKSGTPQEPPCYVASAVGRVASVVTDSVAAFFSDDGRNAIMSSDMTCDGGATVFAENQVGVRGLEYDNAAVYWITGSAVLMLEKTAAGGTPKVLASGYEDLAAISAQSAWPVVYFVDAKQGTVNKVSLTTAPTIVASDQAEPRGVFLGTDGVVFWTNHASGEVRRLDP